LLGDHGSFVIVVIFVDFLFGEIALLAGGG
jgi:hypothetical protein